MTIPFSTLNQNVVPNDPELKDLLDLLKKDIFLNLNCHHIGTIEAFNSANQTATVSVNYTKSYLEPNALGIYSIKSVDYPLILSAPVMCLGGGLAAITFPILPGDECLICFNDRDFDNWFAGSSSSQVATPRKHAFGDAIVIVGVRSLSKILTSYNSSAVEIRYGTNTISINQTMFKASLASGVSLELDATGKLKITNLTGEFVAALYQLMTDIQNAVTNTVFGPQPLIMPTFTTDLAILGTFKS